MQCPRCGAELVQTSAGSFRCACGWKSRAHPAAAIRLLGVGIVLDFLGSAVLAYLFILDMSRTPWIGVAGGLMAAGAAFIVRGAMKLSRQRI